MELTIDLKKWTLRDYRDFVKATKDSDFDVVLGKLSKIISSWTLPGNPTDVNYYLDELNLYQWRDISQKVTEALTAEFDTKK